MTQALRDELIATARRMSELGLAPGTTGNVSVRTTRGFLITPSGLPYDQLRTDDLVAIALDGTVRPGQRAPSTEWQLHRDLLAARPDAHAIVHTHSLFCTTVACLRRPIPQRDARWCWARARPAARWPRRSTRCGPRRRACRAWW